MSEWQPIETAPKDAYALLLWWPWISLAPVVGYWNGGCNYWAVPGRAANGQPTHWMPLPAPPELKG